MGIAPSSLLESGAVTVATMEMLVPNHNSRFSQLTRIQRITIILFVLVLTNWILVSTAGYTLIGADLINLFFILFLILFVLTSIRPLMLALVWRLRNRLLVTYF